MDLSLQLLDYLGNKKLELSAQTLAVFIQRDYRSRFLQLVREMTGVKVMHMGNSTDDIEKICFSPATVKDGTMSKSDFSFDALWQLLDNS